MYEVEENAYIINCPLCCGQTFASKKALIGHLSLHMSKLSCSLCKEYFESINDLITHLATTDCFPTHDLVQEQQYHELSVEGQSENDQKYIDSDTVIQTSDGIKIELQKIERNKLDFDAQTTNPEVLESAQTNVENINLVELPVVKSGTITSLQPNELKFISEDDNGRYLCHFPSGKILTTQNSDGTISLTTVDESPQTEQDGLNELNVMEKEDQEQYSCNTCKVSFTSIVDHIQNFHNNQDVVVQVNDAPENDEDQSQELDKEYQENNKTVLYQEVPITTLQRVITENGNIVTHDFSNYEKDKIIVNEKGENIEEEVRDKKGRLYTRKLVQIDKFWDEKDESSAVLKFENTNNNTTGDNSKIIYHQAVLKEIDSTDGSGRIKVFNCISCNVYVKTLDEFKAHPCKKMKYSCPHCPVTYDNSKSLCAHMKVHKAPKGSHAIIRTMSPTELGPFVCDVCCTVFPTNKSLRLHKRMHDPAKVRPIEPPVNDSQAKDVSLSFHCEQCDKWIPTGYKTVHESYHKQTTQYHCDICNRKFHSNDYLVMHMNVHNYDKAAVNRPLKKLPYACSFCRRQFARPHEKVKHERIHTGEKPHSCEICGKSFRVSYCLTLHMRTHTGVRPYGCEHCGKRFKAHSVYNHHLLTHSDVRAYKCPFCPKAFKTSVQLAGHKNSHTKPFSCKECNRPFASLYAVRVHTETHNRQNNLKYSCKQCGATYARTFALKDHMRQVHQKEEPVTEWEENEIAPSPDADPLEILAIEEKPTEVVHLSTE